MSPFTLLLLILNYRRVSRVNRKDCDFCLGDAFSPAAQTTTPTSPFEGRAVHDGKRVGPARTEGRPSALEFLSGPEASTTRLVIASRLPCSGAKSFVTLRCFGGLKAPHPNNGFFWLLLLAMHYGSRSPPVIVRATLAESRGPAQSTSGKAVPKPCKFSLSAPHRATA